MTRETLRSASGAPDATSTLPLIERGRANPTWDTVKKIAAALDSSMGDLGSRTNSVPSCPRLISPHFLRETASETLGILK